LESMDRLIEEYLRYESEDRGTGMSKLISLQD
jgi:hypothetical protein